jgi:hypothetical protein
MGRAVMPDQRYCRRVTALNTASVHTGTFIDGTGIPHMRDPDDRMRDKVK